MWNKLFIVLLAVSVAVVAALMFISHSWLQSVTNPRDVVANYEAYSQLSRNALFIASIILFLVSNAVLFSKRRSWALWTTFLFFAIFILAQTWWLDGNFFAYKKINNLTNGETSLTGIAGVIACMIAAAVAFFDQIIVTRMSDRIYVQRDLRTKPIETTAAESTKN